MDTQEAVIPVAQITVTVLRAVILTPEARASSSDRGSKFIRQRRRARMSTPTIIRGEPMASVE